MFRRIFSRKTDDPRPGTIYAAIMAASRQPAFYAKLGVDDSLEGRFEILVLHASLVARRLGAGSNDAKAMSQEVFDLMFIDLDQAMRESGVGDLAVPKRIRRMAEAYYGRAKAYGAALAEDEPVKALVAAVERNIYGSEAGPAEDDDRNNSAMAVAQYIQAVDRTLAQTDEAPLLEGKLTFPAAEDFSHPPRNAAVLEATK